MLYRSMVLTGLLVLCAGVAAAQQPRDITDPSITKKPMIDAANVVPPPYPGAALYKGLEGDVVIKVCVDEKGKTTSAELSKSSGHKELDDAAVSWVRQRARFLPAQASGKAVAVCNYAFNYTWTIDKKRPDRTGDDRFKDISDYVEVTTLKPGAKPFIRSQPPLPRYPAEALARKAEGPVGLVLCIAPDGTMASVSVQDFRVDKDLLAATIMWFGASTYASGKKDGKPVGVCGFEVEYTWKLPR